MKKTLLISAAAVMMLAASCSDSESKSESTYNIPILNLVTSTDGSSEPVVSGSLYNYKLDQMNSTMEIAAKVSVGNNSYVEFTTNPVTYKPLYYSIGGIVYEVIQAESYLAGKTNNGETLNDLYCELTSFVNIPPVIEGLPDISVPVGKYTFMQYNIGTKYAVRTFWNDLTFKGNTSTTYPGGTFSSKEIMYRVVMDVNKNKATVILYNVQLAEKMPVLTNIVLEDLPLSFNNGGYIIKAENITPKQFEGGSGTPNSNYVFTKFELSSYGDLSTANCNYEVNGMFTGTFSGSCISPVKNMETE